MAWNEQEKQIVALRTEAAEAGDFEMVVECTKALSGVHPAALKRCLEAIAAAREDDHGAAEGSGR